MTYDMNYYSDRLHCTPEEKQECLETVRLVTQAFDIVHHMGLLSLDELAEGTDDPFFQDCAHYVADGLGEEQLRSIYERMLIAGDYRGKALLHNLLVTEGMLAILCMSESSLVRGLAPWFGAGWRKSVADTVRQELERLNSQELRQTSLYPEFDRLLKLPEDQRDALAKKIWESARRPEPDLLLALKCAGEPVKRYLLKGLAPDEREDVRRSLSNIFGLNLSEKSQQAQKRALQQLYKDKNDIYGPCII